jgi:hypothetical protein
MSPKSGIRPSSGRAPATLLLASLFLISLAIPSGAHVPVVPGDGEGSTIVTVPDPLKSWAFYGTLHGAGETDLFRFTMRQGDRLVVSLQVPEATGPVPVLVIMGPGLSTSGTLPSGVEVPPGSPAVVIAGVRPPRPFYEPFSPAAAYRVASLDTTVTVGGEYRVAVAGPGGETPYGLAIGYLEEFSPAEWVMVPVTVLQARIMQGQALPILLSPFIAMLILGAFLFLNRDWHPRLRSPAGIAAAAAGVVMLGSAAGTLVQMCWALAATGPEAMAAITSVLIILAAIPGYLCLRIALAPSPSWRTGERLTLVAAGLFALVVWSGFLVGPILAVLAAVLPGE